MLIIIGNKNVLYINIRNVNVNKNIEINSLFVIVFLNIFMLVYQYICFLKPVPAGISLPTITFSFNPNSLSFFPFIAASVRTLVVS